MDAVGDVQRILLLGGTSELGLAIVRRFLAPGRHIQVVLAGRNVEALGQAGAVLTEAGARIRTVLFDAADTATHPDAVATAWRDGDVDLVVVAFGSLGDQDVMLADPAAAAALVQTNTVGAVSVGLEIAQRLREQGHGSIIALSSIAAARGRPSNFIYGASKAGFDTFFDGLSHDLAPLGIRVVVLRPGFVRTRMTAGLDEPPLASSIEDVARAARAAVGRTGPAFVSPAHRALHAALRVLPRRVIARLR